METYNLKLQHVNSDQQLQDESLDSFSNVIHYDSALIDQTTGKKPSTEQVSDSSQFAWSSLQNTTPQSQNTAPQSQNSAPQSQKHFLPTPFQEEPPFQHSPAETSTSSLLYDDTVKTRDKSELANQINRMIRDVYSEVEIPFNPLQQRKQIPDWIFLDKQLGEDYSFGRQPQHIVAQPSRVKVTHVYNQCVLTQVPSSPAQVTQLITPSNHAVATTTTGGGPVVTECDIKTLLQVSANTSLSRQYTSHQLQPTSVPRMAEYSPTRDGGKESEPFESVADALHLQQSVIGGGKHYTPVSADVVAQVVAEAERKIKLGHTPTPVAGLDGNITPTASLSQASSTAGSATTTPPVTSLDLPPVPRLPDPAATRELIRIQAPNIVRSSERTSWFGSGAPSLVPETRNPSVTNPAVLPTPFSASQASSSINAMPDLPTEGANMLTMSQLDNVMDDNQSIASTSSEVENINDNATEAFLKSLPPFKAINLSNIMPEPQPKLDQRHSPPVKETSFRPLSQGDKNSPVVAESGQGYQSFVTDSGVFLPETDRVLTPQANTLPSTKSKFVIPKPGPLFQSTPRPVTKAKAQESRRSDKSGESNAQVDEILREKAKLEGQLEMLSIEAQATLQERAELQAQVASLKLKLMSQKAQKHDAEKDVLKADLESLKQLRISLEESLGDLQRELEEKSEEGRNLQDELNQSQEATDKLNLKLKEIKDEIRARDMTIQALKNKVAELYVEVQTSMQTKMEADNEARSAKGDLISLQNTKDWYQQQLELATKARSELQRDMTLLQAQAASQTSIIERLKSENARLRQQFTEIQNKALKEKEMLAKHLEAIESDMMDREAAFQEIQRERSFLEDTFNTKIQTAEDEKSRISLLMQMTTDLENQLDKAHADLKKKQNQIVTLENENIELMKKLSLSQETAMEKDSIIEDLQRNMIDLEERLKAFQNSVINKDSEILELKEEKAKTEIALKSALLEKSSVDEVLDSLKADMGKVETSFKVMRQELSSKSTEMTDMKTHTASSDELVDKLKSDLDNEKRVCELTKQELEKKTEQLGDLQGQKIKLDSDILILKEKMSSMENSHEDAIKEKQFLDAELNATRDKLEEVKQQMQVQIEEEKTQKSTEGGADYKLVQEECVQLKGKITDIEKSSKKDQLKQKARATKLTQDLNAVKGELLERQKVFDENIEVVSGKLREVVGGKEKLDTELAMVHRKYELSMLQQKDQIGTELQKLAGELQQARLDKQELETGFLELQHVRDTELQQYRAQLSALDGELKAALEAGRESSVATETNTELQLELEKEKGRLEGLQQSNATLKQHVAQLEDALAGRESALVDVQTQMAAALREREQESAENIARIQTLETTLQKEKDGQRDTRKQIGLKITENKKLRRNNDALKQETETAKQELEARTSEARSLRAELESGQQELAGRQAESRALEGENKGLQRELGRAQQQLADIQAREPVIHEQIKSLEWQLKLKCSELEAAQQQVKQEEERQAAEIHGMKQLIQEKNIEIDGLKLDVTALKQDKQQQVARVTELRSALKSSIQHHKVTQKMSKLKVLNGGGDAGQVELPPLPFDLDDMDKLLQDTTVRALESKPLDNLQNCLLNLRSEISGLQQQMEVHTDTLQTSTQTWTTLEQQVEELRHVVQTISNTTMSTSTTNSLAAAAVDIANNSTDIFDI